MAGEVIVDALPYIDQGYDEPGVREAALAMVEEETRRYRPTKNYLEHLQPLNITAFETEVMKHEFERMQNRLPMEVLSMKRYELPPPPSGKLNDLAAWNESVQNSSAQLEHQATRICNLELMMDYGCEAWKSYLEVLVQLVGQAQKQLQVLRKMIQEINWQRKSMQTQGGDKLRALEAQWVGLVSKNYEIEQACVHLEEEIQKIMMSKEAVEINDVPAEEGPDVPEKSATETMALQMEQQENQDT
ncbi:Pre-mRNA-splicing factor SPF27 [Camponotus japonicus]